MSIWNSWELETPDLVGWSIAKGHGNTEAFEVGKALFYVFLNLGFSLHITANITATTPPVFLGRRCAMWPLGSMQNLIPGFKVLPFFFCFDSFQFFLA